MNVLLGNKIKEVRAEQDVRQRELADMLNIDVPRRHGPHFSEPTR